MKTKFFLLLIVICSMASCENTPAIKQDIFSSDIANFWTAYDKIISTKDSTLKYEYLHKLFLDKGSIGLKNIRTARNYTAKDYIDAIENYPKFWTSIRENTNNTQKYNDKVIASIQQLRQLYPDLKTRPIYFTMGAFRTGGTILDSTVLIGSEMSFADKSTVVEELPDWRQPFFKEYNPIEGIDLLCTHEYVHTQQKELVDNLLSYCLYEGVAEFVSTLALGVPSNTPAVQYGKDHEAVVKAKFEEDIYLPQHTYNWLWGENRNELKVRDLGYYIGYSICENYYKQARDKPKAIKEMIELDFSKEKEVEAFVEASKFLSAPLTQLNEDFEKSRPTVVSMEPLKNGDQEVNPNLKRISLNFSTAMDKEYRGFDYGPLGEEHVLSAQKVIGFSEDGKTFTFEIALAPNKRFQSLVTNGFRSVRGVPLRPFLIDFKTR